MLKGVGLCFYALFLMILMKSVDAEPARNGGRVDIDVVDKQGPTERQYLDDD